MAMTEGDSKRRIRFYMGLAAVLFSAGFLSYVAFVVSQGMGGPVWLTDWAQVFGLLLISLAGLAYFVSVWIRRGGP